MPDDLSPYARILHAARHRSRRQAKRLIHEAGGKGTSAELDRLLGIIASHPQRAEIEDLVESFRAAEVEAERIGDSESDRWFFAEGIASRASYVWYLCPTGAESFYARIFDSPEEARDWQSFPADDGQVIGQICWLDGEVSADRQKELMREARRMLRVYDAQLGL